MDTVVRTRQGAVRGKAAEGVVAFKGIPYAAPPFGAQRFRPPQRAELWDGVRDALNYGPTVTKPPYFPPFDALLPEPAIAGEDCLNLNIWTSDLGKAGLPVMVWIHGGAFVFDTLDIGEMEAMVGDNPPQEIANAMHSAWVSFATRGDPGWPQYELDRRATMRFDVLSELVEDPRSAERLLWEGLR